MATRSVGALLWLCGLAAAQQASAPQGAQLLRIAQGVAAARNVIASMPPGPDRYSAELGLAAFERMLASGKVKVTPTPGRRGVPTQPGWSAGTNANGAWTSPEYEIDVPGVVNANNDRAGGTPEIGGGREGIELGGYPSNGQAPGPSLVGDWDGGDPSTDSELAGLVFIHEGIRCVSLWERRVNGMFRGFLDCWYAWSKEIELYSLHLAYLDVCIQAADMAGNSNRVARLTDVKARRQERVDKATAARLLC